MDVTDIHVCVSAYACDPTRGSEPGIGWNLVRELARRHHVWAVTRRRNQRAIDAELRRAPLPRLHMVYVDWPDALRYWKRGQWGIEIYYRCWQAQAARTIRRLHREVRFDIAQHATFGRYWSPTALADLPVPFVWGPIGGGETAPPAFLESFGVRGRLYERIRSAARAIGERDPGVRHAARSAALALAVTAETRDRLLALGTRRVELFSAMGFDRAEFERLVSTPSPPSERLRFISSGRLLHWKGFHLGLEAFAAAGIPGAEYWIVGDGPERGRLARLAARLRLESRVRFWGALSRASSLERLSACHVLVHPSLHDSGGWVCLEAMAAARPVICLDRGGPAEQVTSSSGIKVAARNPGQAVADLAAAMRALASEASVRGALGQAARERVEREYLWEKKADRLQAWYAALLTALPVRVS